MSNHVDTSALVDWTIFDQYPENSVECRCGAVYRSHSKCVAVKDGLKVITRKACPTCGESVGHPRAVRSDAEHQTL